MPARPVPSPRRSDHHQELLELLEARDRRTEEWRETTREHREEMRALDSRIIRVRDILAGRDHHQEEIPGTGEVALPPKKAVKTSKKFPLGGEEREKCTACGYERGEHAGSRCPVEIPSLKTGTKAQGAAAARDLEKRIHHEDDDDDIPGRDLTLIDEVEGVTHTIPARRKAR